MWLLLAFLIVPLLEIALFIQVGGWLGLWPTLGIVVLTAILGTVLVRAQGLAAMGRDCWGCSAPPCTRPTAACNRSIVAGLGVPGAGARGGI